MFSLQGSALAVAFLTEQKLYIVSGKVLYKSRFLLYQIIGQHLFLFLQLQDLFFDRVFTYHLICEHLSFLSDAMCAVDGLLFCGGIPPGIDEINIIRNREVKSYTAGLERYQECLYVFIILKFSYLLFSLGQGGFTIKITICDARLFKFLPYQMQHLREL